MFKFIKKIETYRETTKFIKKIVKLIEKILSTYRENINLSRKY